MASANFDMLVHFQLQNYRMDLSIAFLLDFQKKFFTSFLSKLCTIYGVSRMKRNFDDHSDFQQKAKDVYLDILKTKYANLIFTLKK